ncbi:MAG: response regulator transcription factor [Thermomonas sp.]|nr:MAG: response regulator transcription factor [Thermomonas sp.]
MQAKTGKPSVMVVEDDNELRERILVPGLRSEGFEVDSSDSAMTLYRALSLRSWDLFVVDIGLPDENGFEVARHLRQRGEAGIVILTGRASAEDQVRGLDGGADAYLSKPVGVDVLAAALRSVLRRIAPGAQVVVPVPMRAGWCLQQQGWQLVSPSGSRVALARGERLLLTLLTNATGEVVEREVIIDRLRSDDREFDPHRLEMLVHRLRRKVRAASGEDLPLNTVRGLGYLLLP